MGMAPLKEVKLVEPGLKGGIYVKRERVSSIVSKRTKWGHQNRIKIKLRCLILKVMEIYGKPAAI
jgi:hypothetical protein